MVERRRPTIRRIYRTGKPPDSQMDPQLREKLRSGKKLLHPESERILREKLGDGHTGLDGFETPGDWDEAEF